MADGERVLVLDRELLDRLAPPEDGRSAGEVELLLVTGTGTLPLGRFRLVPLAPARRLEEVCARLLVRMGASPGWEGFGLTARCVGLLGEGRLLKEVYLEAAGDGREGLRRAEVNIRRLAHRLWTLDTPLYREIFAAHPPERRPTNGGFLRTLADYARRSL